MLQAISPVSPVYPIVAAAGPEHRKQFIARVTWNGIQLGEGEGRSKKDAEISAARDALEKRGWESFGKTKNPDRETTANNPPTTANDHR